METLETTDARAENEETGKGLCTGAVTVVTAAYFCVCLLVRGRFSRVVGRGNPRETRLIITGALVFYFPVPPVGGLVLY